MKNTLESFNRLDSTEEKINELEDTAHKLSKMKQKKNRAKKRTEHRQLWNHHQQQANIQVTSS